MKLSEAVELLVNATLADGRSERTAESYAAALAALVDFLGADRAVEGVTIADLRAYVARLRGQGVRYAAHPGRAPVPGGLAAATIASRVRAVKRLFRFLEDEGAIVGNPARRLLQPRPGRGVQPKAITAEDLLGHSSVLTTWASYAIFNTEELGRIHAQHNPLLHYYLNTPEGG